MQMEWNGMAFSVFHNQVNGINLTQKTHFWRCIETAGFAFPLVVQNVVFILFLFFKTSLTNGFSTLYLQCWDECTASTSINKSILDTWSLSVQSMVRDNSLVSTNIAWTATNSPSDCLVTCKFISKYFLEFEYFFFSILSMCFPF